MLLHHDDARNVVVSDIGCIVSDPPYKLSGGGKSSHPDAPSGGWMKEYDNRGSPVVCDITWPEVMDIYWQAAASQSHVYVFVNDKNLRAAQNAAHDCGFRLHNVLTWYKRTAMPNRYYMKNQEFCLFLFKGKARTINKPGSMALREMPWPDETNHPTEKPWPLLQGYIENSSELGEQVFDPFMGAGSTGKAAIRSGRDFIGIEIEQQWFEVAQQRCLRAERDYALRNRPMPSLPAHDGEQMGLEQAIAAAVV